MTGLPAKVQSKSTHDTASSTTTPLAYTSNLGAANLLVAACIWNSNTLTCSVSSSNNSTWTPIGSAQRGTGNLASYSIQCFYKLNSTAGADTVTMTTSNTTTDRYLAIHEFSGIDTASALEASTYSGNVTAVTNVITTASSITTVNAPDLLFCAAMVDNAVSSAGTGYTLLENVNFGSNGTEFMLHYATGTYTATFNTSATTDAGMILVAFKQTPPTLGANNSAIVQSYNGGTALHTASAGTQLDLTGQEAVEIDTLCVRSPGTSNGLAIAYLEIVAKTSVSLTNTVRLLGGTSLVSLDINAPAYAGIDIPSGTTSYTYFRSANFLMSQNDKCDFGLVIGAGSGGTTTVLAWRVNVLEGAGTEAGYGVLYTTETQVELGNNETGTNAVAAALAKPKYWTYNSADYDGGIQFFVSARLSGTGGTVTCKLQQDDGAFGSWTDFLTVYNAVLNGLTWPIISFSSQPTSGRHYRLTMATSSGTWGVYNAKVLIDQFEGGTLYDGGTNFYNNLFNVQGGTAASAQTDQAKAQSFVIRNACTLSGVRMTIKKVGAPGDNLQVDIVSTLGGSSLATGSIAGSSLTTSMAQVDIAFASFTPTLGTTYYVQLTRSGARDTSNYYVIEGDSAFNDQIGQGWTRANNAWATFNYDLIMLLKGAAGLKKIGVPFQLLNTGSTTTGNQNMPMKWVSSEWLNYNPTPYHQMDSNNASNSAKLTDTTASADLASSTVTGNNEQQSGALVWPADGDLIDSNIVTAVGTVEGTRVYVKAVRADPLELPPLIYQAVNRAARY